MKKLDESKVAPGLCVEDFGRDAIGDEPETFAWQAFWCQAKMTDDMGAAEEACGRHTAPRASAEVFHETEAKARAASHRYYLAHSLPAIEHAFAMLIERMGSGELIYYNINSVIDEIRRGAEVGR